MQDKALFIVRLIMFGVLCLIVGYLYCMTAHASEWSLEDTLLEVTSEMVILGDYSQTKYVSSHPQIYYETNIILGTHPSEKRVDTYFISALVLHPVISYMLPKNLREVFEGFTIGIEGESIYRNHEYGVHFQKLF